MGFNFHRMVRSVLNPKSGFRRGFDKITGKIDRGILDAGKAFRKIAPAAAAAIPELAPATAGLEGALSGYERIRNAVRGG